MPDSITPRRIPERTLLLTLMLMVVPPRDTILAGDMTPRAPVYNNKTGVHPDCADPFVLRDGGVYYLYVTSGAPPHRGIRVYQSCDLVNWTVPEKSDDGFALVAGDVWGDRAFWSGDELIFVYHAHCAPGKIAPRKLCIDRCRFVPDPNGGPDRFVIDGPTSTPQPGPR